MTIKECAMWVWENEPIDKASMQKAGLRACLAIVNAMGKAINGGRPIEALSFNNSYIGAATALTDWAWKTAVKYYNENVASSIKMHLNVVSFKSRGRKITMNEVESIKSCLYDVLQ